MKPKKKSLKIRWISSLFKASTYPKLLLYALVFLCFDDLSTNRRGMFRLGLSADCISPNWLDPKSWLITYFVMLVFCIWNLLTSGLFCSFVRKWLWRNMKKVLEERRKAFQALKTEERKVDTKEFESMQALSSKKDNHDIFIKLVCMLNPKGWVFKKCWPVLDL